ncbi:MAG: NifB/NifX family molybdenum-iron cluster-binding protein [Thermoproteota archaeon]|nr:NifB/NifX family molybdenum-iron cluster-binding protein [Thermoproteota archaeon]
MSLKKFRIAVATTAHGGLEDIVCKVFGRANTFTIIDVEESEVKNVKVLENPALSYKHGAGPIVVKMLVDSGVNLVVGTELGPGASALLEQHNVNHVIAKPGVKVKKSLEKVLGRQT